MSEEITDIQLNDQNERFEFWTKRVADFAASNPGYYNFIEKTKPHKAVTVLMMLEQQESERAIMARCQVNGNTIRGIRERHSSTIQDARKQYSRMFAMLTQMTGEVAYKKLAKALDDDTELDKIALKDLAIASGVWTDKGNILDGAATSIVEVRKGASVSDAAALIEEARQRIARGKVVESPAIEA